LRSRRRFGTHVDARRRSGDWDRDTGFTLIELLIVVAILPLVVGAISVALLAIFKNETPIASSLTSSGDAQVASSYYLQDVQSANWVTTAPGLSCGGVTGTLLLSISSDDVASGSAIRNVVSYVEVPNSGSSTFAIERETCTGGTGSPTTNPRVVAHNATSATTVSINPGTVQTAAASGWTPAPGTAGVQLLLVESIHGSTNTISYTFKAVPRVTGTPGANPSGFNPILPVMFVGTSCPSLTLTGSGSFVDSQNGGGQSGSGFVGYTQSQSQCQNQTSGAGTLKYAAPAYYNVANPFAQLAPPTSPSTSGLEAGSCSATTCTAGSYGASTTGGYANGALTNVTVDPSQGAPVTNLVVFTVPVTIKNTNVMFLGGSSLTNVTYWFQQGLTISTHANVTFGAATYIFGTSASAGLSVDSQSSLTAPNSSSGLIFYVPPGAANVSLASGISGTLGGAPSPYDGIAIWDDSTGLLSFGQGNGGGSGLMASYGGIYDPNGTMSIAGNYQMQAQFMVVNNASVQTSQVTMTG
jgi:prepilin-type N-terminal cleavage/methylation domain-containing protein